MCLSQTVDGGGGGIRTRVSDCPTLIELRSLPGCPDFAGCGSGHYSRPLSKVVIHMGMSHVAMEPLDMHRV